MAGSFTDGSFIFLLDKLGFACVVREIPGLYITLSENLFKPSLSLYFHGDFCLLSRFAIRTSSFRFSAWPVGAHAQAHTLSFIHSDLAPLRSNSHTVKFMLSKCAIQQFQCIHRAVLPSPLFNFKHFHHLSKKSHTLPPFLPLPQFSH